MHNTKVLLLLLIVPGARIRASEAMERALLVGCWYLWPGWSGGSNQEGTVPAGCLTFVFRLAYLQRKKANGREDMTIRDLHFQFYVVSCLSDAR